MVISVRLKPETRKLLDRVARSQRLSRSEVVRRAIEALAQEQGTSEASEPYQALKDLIGRVRGGPPDLSERTGARFAEILRKKSGRTR